MKAILEEFDYTIDLIKAHDPDLVIYEDGWQVVAMPWRGLWANVMRKHRVRN